MARRMTVAGNASPLQHCGCSVRLLSTDGSGRAKWNRARARTTTNGRAGPLRPASYASRFTHHVLRITFHASRLTHHVLRITSYASRFTHHVLRITFHVSRLPSSVLPLPPPSYALLPPVHLKRLPDPILRLQEPVRASEYNLHITHAKVLGARNVVHKLGRAVQLIIVHHQPEVQTLPLQPNAAEAIPINRIRNRLGAIPPLHTTRIQLPAEPIHRLEQLGHLLRRAFWMLSLLRRRIPEPLEGHADLRRRQSLVLSSRTPGFFPLWVDFPALHPAFRVDRLLHLVATWGIMPMSTQSPRSVLSVAWGRPPSAHPESRRSVTNGRPPSLPVRCSPLRDWSRGQAATLDRRPYRSRVLPKVSKGMRTLARLSNILGGARGSKSVDGLTR